MYHTVGYSWHWPRPDDTTRNRPLAGAIQSSRGRCRMWLEERQSPYTPEQVAILFLELPTGLAEATRADLEHPHALLAEQRAHRELAILAGQCPDHLLGMDCYPGRARRYVARAKPGTTATPWLVITTDISELRAVLTPRAPG